MVLDLYIVQRSDKFRTITHPGNGNGSGLGVGLKSVEVEMADVEPVGCNASGRWNVGCLLANGMADGCMDN